MTKTKTSEWKTLRSGVKQNGNWYVGLYLTGWYCWNAKMDGYGPFKTEKEAMAETTKQRHPKEKKA